METNCTKCNGTGKYDKPLKDGSVGACFTCKGAGKVKANIMTEKQVKYIGSLFAQVRAAMPQDKQDSLIKIMKAHLSGEKVQTTKWASAAIEALKSYEEDLSAF